ncbi:hypothetical protein KVV02_004110 [Mortierella alpina]|uniref:C2H2-type domain-containing protein n=1 Tax=Mortierella alpina TaxID=64518 RepID=A0A9P7ZYI2_MORAP|nr:hypothetical protein KVV02_004110 [Mortierella alpina]
MRCNVCSIDFNTAKQHRGHTLELHSSKCTVTQHDGQKVTLIRTDGVFRCDHCKKPCSTKSAIRSHLARQCRNEEELGSDPPRRAVTVPDTSPAALMQPLSFPEPMRMPRDHDDAVLLACQRQSGSEVDKIATLGVVHFLGLEPFTLNDTLGREHNALAHPDVIKRLCVGQLQSPVTVPNPSKRKLMEESVCVKCSPISEPSLDSVFAFSTYSKILRTRSFVELTDSICILMNEDWTFQPQYRYGCPQMLAGSILFNTSNGHAVLVNNIEAYGRTSMVDAHCEPFGLKKGVAVRTSLPKPGTAHYRDVWPSTMIAATEGERLVIGTQAFDALVTSSVRLDAHGVGSIGAITGTFQLSNDMEGAATKIFLDKESVQAGVALCQDPKAYRITNIHLHCQLRQLKTKFFDPSTFFLCKATGPLTKAHSLQPCTIYTFCNHSQSGDGHHASRLFFKIARAVLQAGNDAVLEVETMQECRRSCSNETKNIPPVLDSILELFTDGASTIPILGNRQLNGYLETLANLLSSYISGVNNNILTATIQSLED